MTDQHIETIIKLLEEIKELLQNGNQQPTTKITVVGNKPQTQIPKGLQTDEDFKF
jgi:hypothetical protein